MNFKLKQENVFQTRQLNVINIFPRFRPKMMREAYHLVLQQNSEQSKPKVGCQNFTNLNLTPNQLEENVTAAKASLEFFLLNTTN